MTFDETSKRQVRSKPRPIHGLNPAGALAGGTPYMMRFRRSVARAGGTLFERVGNAIESAIRMGPERNGAAGKSLAQGLAGGNLAVQGAPEFLETLGRIEPLAITVAWSGAARGRRPGVVRTHLRGAPARERQ